ncbi:hypothetical protein CC86DRAFT_411575 [Ophiobolus disseminans]|uniref:Uncharacterized protein n=1 Tax=Ophiobolus disseminans TaxID=1469910 RepID=A0A6A6ZM08_9PLEO|nr:hypothetical protein CC86DRAFT_411575 [Ophiobolus disseminans]
MNTDTPIEPTSIDEERPPTLRNKTSSALLRLPSSIRHETFSHALFIGPIECAPSTKRSVTFHITIKGKARAETMAMEYLVNTFSIAYADLKSVMARLPEKIKDLITSLRFVSG